MSFTHILWQIIDDIIFKIILPFIWYGFLFSLCMALLVLAWYLLEAGGLIVISAISSKILEKFDELYYGIKEVKLEDTTSVATPVPETPLPTPTIATPAPAPTITNSTLKKIDWIWLAGAIICLSLVLAIIANFLKG